MITVGTVLIQNTQQIKKKKTKKLKKRFTKNVNGRRHFK